MEQLIALSPDRQDPAAKPAALQVNPDAIPQELKDLPQWVVWRSEWRHDDWTKVLHTTGGGSASSTDPATWTTFALALEAYRAGDFDGIGLVHRHTDNLTALDLDKCRDSDTGLVLPWALEIVERFGTYSEITPSSTGLRVYCYGTKPGRRCKKSAAKVYGKAAGAGVIEMYDGLTRDGKQGGRFLTITGHKLADSPGIINERQTEIDGLYYHVFGKTEDNSAPAGGNGMVNTSHALTEEQIADLLARARAIPDADLLDRARGFKNGDDFSALYDRGDRSAHSGGDRSGSAADQALVNRLAWLCGPDPERIDRLFRQSKLYREEKWGARQDYRDRTIRKALEGKTDFYTLQSVAPEADSKVVTEDNRDQGKPAGKKEGKPAGSPAPPGPYFIKDGAIQRRTVGRKGEQSHYALCNFSATITDEVTLDDGSGENQLTLTIAGTLATGRPLPTARVSAEQFPGLSWTVKAWGTDPIVYAGQGNKDHLRVAIQTLSTAKTKRHVYRHTGWREISGTWTYLHSGGGITAKGLITEVSVELDGKLSGYSLPAPPTGEDLVRAIQASLRLLDLAPERITAPVLGAAYRACLPGPAADASVFLDGETGAGKSELTALAQQHYGAGLDRRNLPGAWTSTANALEGQLFLAKDALFVLDDFNPAGSKGDQDAWHGKADRVFRGAGNSSSRQRCWADGSIRPDRPPRCLILATGEDRPRGESCAARRLDIHVRKGDITLANLTPYQEAAAEGLYAGALAGFIRHLAEHHDRARRLLKKRFGELRALATADGQHPRTPGILADLGAGWKAFLQFAVKAGAITREERKQLWSRVWAGLLQAGKEQGEEIRAHDPGRRFLQLLQSAISSGLAYVATTDGEPPHDHQPWGWRPGDTGDDAPLRPQGRCVGWLEDDDLFLDPETAYAVAQRLAEEQGERLTVGRRQLNKRLEEARLLVSKSASKLVVYRTIMNHRRYVLHLRRNTLEAPLP
jgi:hypothetical protein